MRRLNAVVVAFFVAFGVLIQGALPALGCSCMMPNPYSGLANADGAFVGTLVDVDTVVGPVFDGGEMIDFYFEVEATLKGDIAETVVVKSAADGAACGIEIPVGTRAGFLLERPGGEWEGSLCATLDADTLLAAAEGLPEPVAGSPPHLIVATEMGTAGLVAIDRQGQVVGYGEGPFPWMVSACPDDDTFIGATSDTAIKVWSYSDLGVVSEHQLDATGGAWVGGLVCTGPAGDSFLALKVLSGNEQSNLVRYSNGDVEVVAEDIERLVPTASGPVAVGSDGIVYEVDPATGVLTALSESIGNIQGQVVAAVATPGGAQLALSTLAWSSTPYEGAVSVIDLIDGTTSRIEVACDVYPVWLDEDRLSFTDSCTSEVSYIYSEDLVPLEEGTAPIYAHTSYVTDETGAIFYPSELAVNVIEPGTDTANELARLLSYPGSLLVVPASARAKWSGPVFTATDILESPPTTFVEAEVPGPAAVGPESPVWLLVLGVAAAGGAFWLLLRRQPDQPSAGLPSEG